MCGSIPSSSSSSSSCFVLRRTSLRLFLCEREGGVKFFCLQHVCVKKFEIKKMVRGKPFIIFVLHSKKNNTHTTHTIIYE